MSKIINQLLFILYLIILVWIIVFKLETNMFKFLETYYFRNINLTPYKYYTLSEVSLNILIFIPFGIFMKSNFNKLSLWTVIATAFIVSLFFETLQYLLAVGHSDITDLIDNTLGAFIGVILFQFINYVFEEKTTKFLNYLSIILILIFIFLLQTLSII